MRTTTRSVPAASSAMPSAASRAGLPSRQPAALARAESRSVSDVDNRVKVRMQVPPRVLARRSRCGIATVPGPPGGSADLHQVDHEDQRGPAGDRALPLVAVGQVAGHGDHPPAALPHAGDALLEPGDDLTRAEGDGQRLLVTPAPRG